MEFFKYPNLPDRRVKGVIVSREADIKPFKDIGITTVLSYKSGRLQESVSAHPDMTIIHLGDGRFMCSPDSYKYYKTRLTGAKLIKGHMELESEYPNDICYNATILGDYIFLNPASAQIKILDQNVNRKILNVRQGYTKCSICIINRNAIITSDTGIYKTAVKSGFDALLIRAGHIELSGMNYGFIGGASGLLAPDTLAVYGDIKTHPDCDNIIGFCKNHGVYIISLTSGRIRDIGSILPIF